MRLRRHRRNVVVWSSSAPPADRYAASRRSRPARIGQVRRLIRIGVLLTIIAVRPRWGFLLAGTVLTAIGVIERNGAAPSWSGNWRPSRLRRSGATSKRPLTGTRTASRTRCAPS